MSLKLLERSVQMLVGAILWVAILAMLFPGAAEAQSSTASMKDDGSTTRSIVVVGPGDSLWSISREWLGPNATPQQIDREVERIYALNRDRIGADPNLILPGQELLVAPEGEPAVAGRRVADRSGEPVVSESASKKVAAPERAAKTSVKTSTTDPQAEPAAPHALPAGEAVPKAGSLRAEGDPLTWPTVASLASSRLFALVIIVVAACPLALLVWTLRMQERREARKRRSWEERYGKHYSRFDPFLSFEDTLRPASGAPEPELGSNGSAPGATTVGNGLDRVGILAAARAGRSAQLSRGGMATGAHNPQVIRHLRCARNRAPWRTVAGRPWVRRRSISPKRGRL